MSPWAVGSSGRERPAYPEYVDEFGEDPADLLFTRAADGIGANQPGDLPELARAVTVIRGIQDLDRLEAWRSVEQDLDIGVPDGMRPPVQRALNRRKAELTGAVDDADLSMEGVFGRETLLQCRPTQRAADGGQRSKGLAPGDRAVCDECQQELAYHGPDTDPRGRIVSVYECENPGCGVGEVHRR